MKKIVCTILIFTLSISLCYAGETAKTLEERVEDLEKKVKILERMLIINNYNNKNNICNETKEEVKYIVTLYDGSTFQIYKWNRKSKTRFNPVTGKRETWKYYEMVDIDGDVRKWSVDKVLKIEKE